MSMGEQQIFNSLIEFFEEDEWDFQWVEGMSVLSMNFSGKNGKWVCYAQAREKQQQFVFYSVLPITIPPERRADMAEFITRANYGMVIGNFEMDFEDGEVRYKTSIDIEGAALLMPLIRQVVYANVVISDRYLPGMMSVLYAGRTPKAAVSAIENDQDSQNEETTAPPPQPPSFDPMLSIYEDGIEEDNEDDDEDDEDEGGDLGMMNGFSRN